MTGPGPGTSTVESLCCDHDVLVCILIVQLARYSCEQFLLKYLKYRRISVIRQNTKEIMTLFNNKKITVTNEKKINVTNKSE